MKPLFIFCIWLIANLSLQSQSSVAWFGQDHSSGHMVTLHIGSDFGSVYGFSYGYKVAGQIPLVIGTELITPFGEKFMDDFKTKLTVQTMVWPLQHVGIAFKPGMSFLRNASAAGVICNISAEMGASLGYFRNTWSIAGEVVYEQSQATLFKHRTLRDYYPEITDEWYKIRGGTFKFGLQASYWLKSAGVAVKAGKVYGQNFSDNPTIPFYADFSVMKRW